LHPIQTALRRLEVKNRINGGNLSFGEAGSEGGVKGRIGKWCGQRGAEGEHCLGSRTGAKRLPLTLPERPFTIWRTP